MLSTCQIGYYLGPTSACIACPPLSTGRASTNGLYGLTNVCACPANYYMNTSTGTCVSCPGGTISTSFATYCRCAPGSYSSASLSGAAPCIQCPKGTYSALLMGTPAGAPANNCLACPKVSSRTLLSNNNSVQYPPGIVIQCGMFYVNGAITNPGRKSQGLLMNSRMIQAVFDTTVCTNTYAYPSAATINGVTYPAGKWNATRNTAEFIRNLPAMYANGLGINGFTVGLQGGSPCFASSVSCTDFNPSAFDSAGNFLPAYQSRLKDIITAAKGLQMIPMISLFYNKQVTKVFISNKINGVIAAVNNVISWVISNGFRSDVIIEIQNECDYAPTSGYGLECNNLHTLLATVRAAGILAGNSVSNCNAGGPYTDDSIIRNSDVLMLHANSCLDMTQYQTMFNRAKTQFPDAYKNQPVVFTEGYFSGSDASTLATSTQPAATGL